MLAQRLLAVLLAEGVGLVHHLLVEVLCTKKHRSDKLMNRFTYQWKESIVEGLSGRNNAEVDIGVGELRTEESIHLVVVAGDMQETPQHVEGLVVAGVHHLQVLL